MESERERVAALSCSLGDCVAENRVLACDSGLHCDFRRKYGGEKLRIPIARGIAEKHS